MESYGRMRESLLDTNCDYYQEFGFKRKESTDQLRQDVERVRRQWRQLAVLSGNKGAEASKKLHLLADAALVFQDDASREAYDQALLSQPVEDSAPIDWIAEARKYYFVDDDDAARAAASKARAVHGNDPQSYVISAWIELREGSRVNGKKEQTTCQSTYGIVVERIKPKDHKANDGIVYSHQ